MAKTKVRPGWITDLDRASDGKRPWVCTYGDANGDKRRKSFGCDRDEARKKYRKFADDLENGLITASAKNRTFGDLLDEYERWCEERRRLKQKMSASRLVRIRRIIRNQIRPTLGHVRLVDLDTHIIEKLVNELAERYRRAHREAYIVIKSALDRAVYIDWLAISPLTKKKPMLPPEAVPVTSIPTIEEGRAIWHALQERGHKEGWHTYLNRRVAIALAMFGGCERGVVVALHWEDVDWVNGAINICRSWSPEEHQLSGDGLKDTKNRFRVRTIPMSQAMRESLTAVWERDGRPASGYVLRHTSRNSGRSGLYWAIGETYLPGVLLKAGFVENGKPKWTFHDLRHYAGSIWLEAGAAIHDVSRMLGHANTAITEKVYIHYFKKQQAERHREIADRVSALHRLPGGVPALPSPMREKCVIDADDAEIVE